jgi:hypothetical protein
VGVGVGVGLGVWLAVGDGVALDDGVGVGGSDAQFRLKKAVIFPEVAGVDKSIHRVRGNVMVDRRGRHCKREVTRDGADVGSVGEAVVGNIRRPGVQNARQHSSRAVPRPRLGRPGTSLRSRNLGLRSVCLSMGRIAPQGIGGSPGPRVRDARESCLHINLALITGRA